MVSIKINVKWLIVLIAAVLVLIGYFYLEKNKKPEIAKQSAQLGMANKEKIDDSINPQPPSQASTFDAPGWLTSKKIEKTEQEQPLKPVPIKSIKTDEQMQGLSKITDALTGLDMNDPKAQGQLVKIIKEVEKENGTSVLNGIRIDAIRENLEHAIKLNEIGNKMKELEKSNTKEALEEKKKLTQMSMDIVGKIRKDITVKRPNQLTPN